MSTILAPRAPSARLTGMRWCAAGVLALGLATGAQASPFRVDFTGVVTNSRDSGGAFFGGAWEGGQNGLAISGAFEFDTAAYPDQNGLPYYGVYGPVGAFPQPSNLIAASYTVGGHTLSPSRWMGVPSGHSLESANMQDIPPVNFVQQDIVTYMDGSQSLLCVNPLEASTCTGGALATDTLQIQLFGITDFVGSDALAQPFDLDETEIAAIVGGPGGGQRNAYLAYRYDASAITRLLYAIEGEFRLTGLRGAAVSTEPAPVPAPAGLALSALALAGLVRVARARGCLRRS